LGYLIAAYAVALGGFGAYALWLRSRRQGLRRALGR
jgi:hypothetical protein